MVGETGRGIVTVRSEPHGTEGEDWVGVGEVPEVERV